MDTAIATAKRTVDDYERDPRANPAPTPRQKVLARYTDRESERWTDLRKNERTRLAREKQAGGPVKALAGGGGGGIPVARLVGE